MFMIVLQCWGWIVVCFRRRRSLKMSFYALVAFVALLLLANLTNHVWAKQYCIYYDKPRQRAGNFGFRERWEAFFQDGGLSTELRGMGTWHPRAYRLEFHISVSSFVFLKSNLIHSRCRLSKIVSTLPTKKLPFVGFLLFDESVVDTRKATVRTLLACRQVVFVRDTDMLEICIFIIRKISVVKIIE